MTNGDLAARARNSVLGSAIGDCWSASMGSGTQPALFDAVPLLSDDIWMMLATCEAIARAGGRVEADDITAVLRQWSERRGPWALARPGSTGLDLAGRRGATSAAADAGGHAAVAIRVAPLAFVLDLENATDRRLLDGIVAITHHEDDAQRVAVAMLAAMQACLTRAATREPLPSATGPASPALARAWTAVSRHPDDLAAALGAAATGDEPRTVACLTGTLLGATGCAIPKNLLAALPERADIEAVIEPFAQLIAAAAV